MQRFIFALVFLVVGSVSFSQAATRWEYLSFSPDILNEKFYPHTGAYPDFKLLRYGPEVSSQEEAIGLDKALDVLGSAGWELVSVAWISGSTKVFFFKRPVSDARNTAELKVAKKALDQ